MYCGQVGVLQLINALVTSPEELDLRVHLRNELNACGFQALIPELQQDESSVSPRSPQIECLVVLFG